LLDGRPLRALRGKDRYELHVLGKWVTRNLRFVVATAAVAMGTLLWQTKVGQAIVLVFTGIAWDDIWRIIKKILKALA
jgi:hypothetical protein